MRILLVEDSVEQGGAVAGHLRRAGYAVEWATSAEDAMAYLLDGAFDLVVLDLMLPKIDGETFLARLRSRKSTIPVMVMTARGELGEKIRVLDVGADDYLVKPIDLTELEARVRVLLRRPHGHVSSVLTFGGLVFDLGRRRVEIEGRLVPLGQREFRLLEFFLSNLGRLLDKEKLLNHLFSSNDAVSPNAIELYVSRLRKKLAGAPIEIRTVWGEGYIADLDDRR